MDFCIFLFFCFRNLSSSGCSHVGLLFGRKRLASDECALLPHRPAVFMTSQSQSKWQHSQQFGLCVVVVLQPSSNIDLNNLTMFQASNCCECCFHSVPVDRTFDASSLKVALSLSTLSRDTIDSLPESSTCANMLYLPYYSRYGWAPTAVDAVTGVLRIK